MTKLFFVRHALPDGAWEDDRTRPLTEEGRKDTERVLAFFKEKPVDAFYCSPYERSRETIVSTAAYFKMDIRFEEGLRERKQGPGGNAHALFHKRWEDHDYHEEDGESIAMVQERNISVIKKILSEHPDESVVIGTHGTALSSILNYYDKSFGCEDFLRIIDWMPYIIELDFEGEGLVGKQEHLFIDKEYKGK